MFWIITSLVGLVVVLVVSIIAIAKTKKDDNNEKAVKIAEIKKVPKTIIEGKIRKGGVNKSPVMPKSKIIPPTQKNKQKDTIMRKKVPSSRKVVKKYFIQPWQSKRDKKWRFRIKHRNGNIIASSEPYSSKQALYNTIEPMSKEFDIEIREKLEIK